MEVKTIKVSLFISFAPEDIAFVRELARHFQQLGILAKLPEERKLNTSTNEPFGKKNNSSTEFIKEEITANDYILALLSSHFLNSDDLPETLNTVFSDEWANRGITTLPVLLADCKPPAFVKPGQYFTLPSSSEKDISDVVAKVKRAMVLDFSLLKAPTFELLVRDLLIQQGFKDVQLLRADAGVDMVAQSVRTDKAGEQMKDTWFIESKLYHSDRASVETIYQFAHYLRTSGADNKGLLITNSQLTHAAHRVIADTAAKGQGNIHVIEGVELKRLLLQHEDLIDKYFIKNTGA